MCSIREGFRALVSAIVLVALAGCGGSPGEQPAKPISIAVIPMGETHEHWKSLHAGAVKAAQELGVEVVWNGPQKEDDRAEQIKIVEDMIARGVDGILLAPLDSSALRTVVREAKQAGIPTITVDSNLEGDDHISYIATDNHKGGQLGAQRLAEVLGGKGKVILMRVMEGVESSRDREEGFLEEMAKHEGIEIISSNQFGGVTTESGYQTGENLLNRFPEVDGIFCPNESTTFGMLRALTDARKAGAVKFVGFDRSEKLIRALEDGTLSGLVVQNPFRMGELGVRTMAQYLAEPDAEPEKHVDTGVVVATPENLNDPQIAALLRPPIGQYLGE